MTKKLVLGVTGATGMLTARQLAHASPFEVALVASEWGRRVYERECGSFLDLQRRVGVCFDNRDLTAPIASGSVETVGMVIAPCSANTLAEIACGRGANLISRAAHCHLKEQKRLVLCIRETPLSLIDIENAKKVSAAGGIIMPISPPFFMTEGRNPETVSMVELIDLYVDRVLKLFGKTPDRTWEHINGI